VPKLGDHVEIPGKEQGADGSLSILQPNKDKSPITHKVGANHSLVEPTRNSSTTKHEEDRHHIGALELPSERLGIRKHGKVVDRSAVLAPNEISALKQGKDSNSSEIAAPDASEHGKSGYEEGYYRTFNHSRNEPTSNSSTLKHEEDRNHTGALELPSERLGIRKHGKVVDRSAVLAPTEILALKQGKDRNSSEKAAPDASKHGKSGNDEGYYRTFNPSRNEDEIELKNEDLSEVPEVDENDEMGLAKPYGMDEFEGTTDEQNDPRWTRRHYRRRRRHFGRRRRTSGRRRVSRRRVSGRQRRRRTMFRRSYGRRWRRSYGRRRRSWRRHFSRQRR